MVAPAASQLAEELGITSTVVVAMTVSIFVLAYGASFFSHTRLVSAQSV